MWCKSCSFETENNICDLCGAETVQDIPSEVLWCQNCGTPIISYVNEANNAICPLCDDKLTHLCNDLRPVFPEERLLVEILKGQPLAFLEKSVWASNNRYYIDGKVLTLTKNDYDRFSANEVWEQIEQYKAENNYDYFNAHIERFIISNRIRLNYLINEAHEFIQEQSAKYQRENIIVSFSGGKDSTVVSDLVIRALSDPSIVHIFGDTTLEFPSTIDYAQRFRKNNPNTIFKIAKNKEQDFYEISDKIGPPARMLRWCCSMFKTGPITKVLNNYYKDQNILTFYGIRKNESVSRSKYDRVSQDNESIKIQKQKVASPIFFWIDIDIWLYLLSEEIDFNDAYRIGYDRVGCWCCPNNNERAQFLASIYMPEQSTKWRSFLIEFASRIGKPDPEVYVDSGKWKARQGGNGVAAAENIKIKFTNCTTEENAKIYRLNRPIEDNFIELFYPLGKYAPELGKKLIDEKIIIDVVSKIPILSIQPYTQDSYDYAVKIKTLNVAKHDELQRLVSYQIRKYNSCQNCSKCISLCKHGAITIKDGIYRINDEKCKRCKMCVSPKYLDGGCLMNKYLYTKE